LIEKVLIYEKLAEFT